MRTTKTMLILYAITAAVLEFLRADYFPRAYWGPVPQLEWTALALTVLAAIGLVVAGRVRGRA